VPRKRQRPQIQQEDEAESPLEQDGQLGKDAGDGVEEGGGGRIRLEDGKQRVDVHGAWRSGRRVQHCHAYYMRQSKDLGKVL
jgi:hypothetical protein